MTPKNSRDKTVPHAHGISLWRFTTKRAERPGASAQSTLTHAWWGFPSTRRYVIQIHSFAPQWRKFLHPRVTAMCCEAILLNGMQNAKRAARRIWIKSPQYI